MIGLLAFLWSNWSWLAAIAAAVFGLVTLRAVASPWVARALFAGAAMFALYAGIGAHRDAMAAHDTALRERVLADVQTSNQKQIDALRAELADKDAAINLRNQQIAAARTALEAKDAAATQTAVKEAADAAPRDPACKPTPAARRVWNDAIDRLNAAAQGSGEP